MVAQFIRHNISHVYYWFKLWAEARTISLSEEGPEINRIVKPMIATEKNSWILYSRLYIYIYIYIERERERERENRISRSTSE